MGIVRREHKAVCQMDQIILPRTTEVLEDPCERIVQEGGRCSLSGRTADFFAVQYAVYAEMGCFLSRKKAFQRGIGTLEELAEIYTWKQIGYHQKEIALLNTAGYWDPLIAMLDKAVAEGFLSEAVRRMLIIADSPESLMESLEISPA